MGGLWENCCTNDQWIKIPENVIFDGSGSGDGGSGDINELECHSLITVGFKYEPILLPDSNDPMQEFAAVQLWIIRVTMLIAASMPFIAIIGAICGNRFCGYVSMVVSGFFGAMGLVLALFFFVQYIKPEFEFGNDWEIGESFWCGNAAVALIWFFTFVDCLCLSKNYRQTTTIIKTNTVSAGDLEMTAKNPYDNIE